MSDKYYIIKCGEQTRQNLIKILRASTLTDRLDPDLLGMITNLVGSTCKRDEVQNDLEA